MSLDGPDRRFAIDDEEYAQEEEETHETSRLAPGTDHRAGAEEEEANKYPPSAPPPSYREATGTSRFKSLLQSLPFDSAIDSLRTFSRRAWILICRFWPTSRFAQVGVFLVGLWILVIVSGPAFDDAAGAGRPFGYEGDVKMVSSTSTQRIISRELNNYPADLASAHQLDSGGPEPISGDGHIVELAQWQFKQCATVKERGSRTICVSRSTFELDVPTDFRSSDGIFILADPFHRDNLSDGRGKVPGTVEVRLSNDINPSKVKVDVDAEYEDAAEDLLTHATVAKMGAGLTSQGVGIYTFPLLPFYLRRNKLPPLMFHIVIHVAPTAVIPTLRVKTGAMNLAAFTAPRPVEPYMGATFGFWGRRDIEREAMQPRNDKTPTFGRFHLQTGDGQVNKAASTDLEAIGNVRLTASSGDVIVGGRIWGQDIHLTTHNGMIKLEDKALVDCWHDIWMETNNGKVELGAGSKAYGTRMYVKVGNGPILGQDGILSTNKSIEAQTGNGALELGLEVRGGAPFEQSPVDQVFVTAKTGNGAVKLVYKGHEEKVALQSRARSATGNVDVTMHPNFEGAWQLDGLKTSAVKPPSDPNKEFQRKSDKREKRGLVKVHESGSVYRREGSKVDRKLEPKTHVDANINQAVLTFL